MFTTNRLERSLDISVLIATRNRMRLLDATLSHLRRQNLSGIQWEVIVVDNGSADATADALSLHLKYLPLVALSEPQPGKNIALNRALDAARGDLLVFTDDDIEPYLQWLTELHFATHAWEKHSIVCGPIIPEYPAETPAWLRGRPYASFAFAEFAHQLPEGQLPTDIFPFGPNFAVRARALNGIRFCEQIGPSGNSYPMGGETELLKRLIGLGERAVYLPSATVKHFVGKHQIEPVWLYQRAFNFGRGSARLRYAENPDILPEKQVMNLEKSLANKVSDPPQTLSDAERPRFEREVALQYLCGQLYEFRLLATQE